MMFGRKGRNIRVVQDFTESRRFITVQDVLQILLDWDRRKWQDRNSGRLSSFLTCRTTFFRVSVDDLVRYILVFGQKKNSRSVPCFLATPLYF